MKIAVCLKGTEDLIAKDLKGKKILDGRISFDKSKNLGGVNVVYELIEQFKFKDYELVLVDNSKTEDYFNLLKKKGVNVIRGVDLGHPVKNVVVNRNILRDYFLTEIRYILLAKKLESSCPSDNVRVIYFYSEQDGVDYQGYVLDFMKKLYIIIFVLIILFVSFFYMKKKKPKFCLWVIFFLIGK